MIRRNHLIASQARNRPRQLQHTVIRPYRHMQLLHRPLYLSTQSFPYFCAAKLDLVCQSIYIRQGCARIDVAGANRLYYSPNTSPYRTTTPRC
jgi:hypothetical protein